MTYLIDSESCFDLLRLGPQRLLDRLAALKPDQLAVSAVTVQELAASVARSGEPEANLDALHRFLSPLRVLPFTLADALEAGRIRAELAAEGRAFGAFDLLIAGQARAQGLILVTSREWDFRRVDGIDVENWLG